jgi:pilus assembly protein CpaB
MKRARLIVLAIAFVAALGAAWIAKRIVSGHRQVETVERTVGAVDVLVAAKDINLGDSVNATDVKWQEWPAEGITPGLISKANEPNAPNDLSGSIARAPFIAGEPIKEQKLIKASEGGVMAAILPSGMRAISTPIREETAAGGFILPNDRVDVILTRKDKVGNKEQSVSDTIMRNIRVLAIGQALENK